MLQNIHRRAQCLLTTQIDALLADLRFLSLRKHRDVVLEAARLDDLTEPIECLAREKSRQTHSQPGFIHGMSEEDILA